MDETYNCLSVYDIHSDTEVVYEIYGGDEHYEVFRDGVCIEKNIETEDELDDLIHSEIAGMRFAPRLVRRVWE